MKSQKGIAVLALILLVVLVGLIGATGWYVYSSNKKTNESLTNAQNSVNSAADAAKKANDSKKAATPTPSVNNTKINNDYDGWLSYKSKAEGFSIKYPKDWKLKETTSGTNEAIIIEGPNNFEIGYDIYKPNDINFSCKNCRFNNSSEIVGSNYGSPLYVVINTNTVNNKDTNDISISYTKLFQNQQYKSWPYYPSKVSNNVVRWLGTYTGTITPYGADFVYMNYSDFSNKEEVKIADKILRSIRY